MAALMGAAPRAIKSARDHGVKKAVPLQVSAPFHCVLMEPAAARLDEELAREMEIVNAENAEDVAALAARG